MAVTAEGGKNFRTMTVTEANHISQNPEERDRQTKEGKPGSNYQSIIDTYVKGLFCIQ